MKNVRAFIAFIPLSLCAGILNAATIQVAGLSNYTFTYESVVNSSFNYARAMADLGILADQYEVVSASLSVHMEESFDVYYNGRKTEEWSGLMVNDAGEEVMAFNTRETDQYGNDLEGIYYALGNDIYNTQYAYFTGNLYDKYYSTGVIWITPTDTYEYIRTESGWDGSNYIKTVNLDSYSLYDLNNDGYINYSINNMLSDSTFFNNEWTMINSTLTLELADVQNVSSVPVPGAAWLFGSGLAGLLGVSRRNIV